MLEGEHVVDRPDALFNGTSVPFEGRHMFLASTDVYVDVTTDKLVAQGFELIVAVYTPDAKTMPTIQLKDATKEGELGGIVTIGQPFNGAKADVLGNCDEKWDGVYPHHVNAEVDITISVKNGMRDTGTLIFCSSRFHMDGFTFEGANVRPEEVLGGLNIVDGDRTVLNLALFDETDKIAG